MLFKGKKQKGLLALRHVELTNRVEALEDLICPAQSHDWNNIGTSTIYKELDIYYREKYICTRCRKIKTEDRMGY